MPYNTGIKSDSVRSKVTMSSRNIFIIVWIISKFGYVFGLRINRLILAASIVIVLYIILAGASEGLEGPRVLEGAHCRCCSTE